MRTFLLMLGSAFGGVLIFVAAVYGYFYYQWSKAESGAVVHFPPRSEKTVSAAPPIAEERFYGSTGSWIGDVSPSARHTVLAAGPGRLVGSVSSGGQPLQGLRLRLGLNGAVMSQWASSGADGKYEIPVPYGKYRVDGYELDSSLVHKLLAGKIDGPRQSLHPHETVEVAEGRLGSAIDFAFVDPVRKKGPKGEVSLAQPVVVSWEPYPNAAAYRIQIVEQKDPGDFTSHQRLFEWRQQPVVSTTSANLAEQGVALKKGHFYTVEIEALDEKRRKLSEAPRNFHRADFRVVD